MSIRLKAIVWILSVMTSTMVDAQQDSIPRSTESKDSLASDTIPPILGVQDSLTLDTSKVTSKPSTRARPLSRLIGREDVELDSAKLLIYGLDDILSQDSFRIKGLDRLFQHYDPARQGLFDYANLGNMGSAAFPLAYEIKPRIGFRLGYEQYALYHKTEDDIRHFDQVRPFSELFFSGGETQSDLRMKALFSRSFANDVNWVIDYDRISQLGDYSNQAVKQTSLLTSIAYRGHKRLSTFFTYIINSSIENVNGGVEDLSTLTEARNSIRENVETYSSDAGNRLQNQNLIFNAFYRLGRDSTKSEFNNSIQYQVQSFNEFFRFTDANTTTDSSFYKNFFVSERGIRNYNELSRIRNGLFLNSKYKEYYYFKAGLIYDYNAVDISGATDRMNEIYLTFNGGIQLKKRLNIDVDFYYGLLDVANEFSLDARAVLKLSQNQGFNFGFNASRFGINYIQEKAHLNQSPFYEIEASPIILQTLKAEYYHKSWNIILGGKLQNTFNFLYFDSESLPVQDAGLYSLAIIYGKADLKFKSFILENSAYLQSHNKEHLNLPSLFTKNSLSYYGKVFKGKMLLKAGFDFRYIVSDFLPNYNPVIGQFYLNKTVEYTPYPMLDARISFKVSSFTTFVKYENLTSFLREDVEQLVQNYPQFDARFRFGIQWNLWN